MQILYVANGDCLKSGSDGNNVYKYSFSLSIICV